MIYNLSFFLVALIWNLAIISVFSFFASWFFDIFGSIIDSQIIRDNAYVIAMLATVTMFWFGLLAAILSMFFKCKSCGSRIIKPKFPFFISFTKSSCTSCKTEV